VSRAQNSFDAEGKLQDENIQKMLSSYLQGFQTFVHASHMAKAQEKAN
jgi:hypothetical protein